MHLKLLTQSALIWRHCVLACAMLFMVGHGYATPEASLSDQGSERPLTEVLEELSEAFHVFFTYESQVLAKINVDFTLRKEEKVIEAVNRLLSPTGFRYKHVDKRFFVIFRNTKKGNKGVKKILKKFDQIEDLEGKMGVYIMKNDLPLEAITYAAESNAFEVSGTVTNADGEPLEGATVRVKGQNIGVLTQDGGKFTLDIPDGNQILMVSYIGYKAVEVPVNGRTNIEISLETDLAYLDEVVVVGYGTQDRSTVTSAISKVSGDEISAIPVANPTQALQGRAPGLIVTNQGAPGADPVLRIRGLTTPNNNNPLIVIDGVPAGGLNALNASDIESIEVLKDASAGAIYGSRAAGGVILITTKRGQSGEPQVTFDSYVGVSVASNRLDLLNTDQYIEVMTEQQENGGLPIPARFSDASIRNTSIDYQDEVFQQGVVQNYSLGVSGGSANARYLVSLNYLDQEGIVRNNDFERYSIRVNTDFNIKGKVKFGETFLMSYTRSNNVINSGGRPIFEHVTKFAPYLSPRNPDNLGGFNGPDQIDNNDAVNPLRVLLLGENSSRTIKALGNIFAEVEIIPGLTARTSIGMDLAIGRGIGYLPAFFDGEFHNQDFASISESRTTFFSPVWTNTLSFDRDFGDHSISAVAGYEVQDFTTETLTGAGENTLTNDIRTPNSIDRAEDVGGVLLEDGLISYFGRVNYSFAGKYLLQAAFRRDGYSRFGPENKFGNFPSVSVGWNIAKEGFMDAVSAVSTLKLRSSWGRTGNNNALGRYEFQPTVQSGYTYNFGGSQGVAPGATIPGLANEALKWETTTMFNIGFDLGLFNDAVTLSFEYYENNTEDLLFSVPLSGSLGLDRNVRVNTGEARSDGVELALGYRGTSGDFSWDIQGNFATQTNELTSLGTGNPISGVNWQGDIITQVAEGFPIYYFQGWKVDRIFQEDDFNEDGSLKDGIPSQTGAAPGDIKFQDLAGAPDDEGNPTAPDGVIDANDRTNIGSALPDFTYGLNIGLNWKNFDLSVFFQGVAGNEIFKGYAYWTQGMTRVFNGEEILTDRWTPTNTNTNVPRAVSGDPNRNARASDRFIDSGDFFRLKTLTLGYTVDTDNISFLSNLRFFFAGQNLLTITDYEGYDPEVSVVSGANFNNALGIDRGQLPQAKTFTFGVQAKF